MTSIIVDSHRALTDVVPLVQFRLAGLRGRSRRAAGVAAVVIAGLTLAAMVVPAFVPGAVDSPQAENIVVLLPTAYLAFLVATTIALTVASGGRELLPRDEGVAFPISPTTDHLGALLLAPLNIAWLMQAWAILGATAYVVGPSGLAAAQVTALLWLVTATAVAQLVAWCVEWVRRGRHGLLLVRVSGVALALAAAGLVATGLVTALLDRSPLWRVVLVALSGSDGGWGRWLVGSLLLLATGAAAVALGAGVAHGVARRPARDESRAEGRTVSARPEPRSELGALVRTDRASVWRSVPLRRGLVVIALLPGSIAAAGRLEWGILPVLPGIVAAGAALLFSVNAWCLDESGALWRESLPVRPRVMFAARVLVQLELLGLAGLLTVLVAGSRAGGAPTGAEVASLAGTVVVVSVQVVARTMSWSVRRPFAVDLRSARAAPAPPLSMASYSAYLALTSTLTGLLFTLTARAGGPMPALLVALPLLLLAVRRLLITARAWETPAVRAQVVATVSVC
ncbi:MAG: hypothetical protein GEU96_11775 [Propionibacteriales bacterium]|nr:hypothetical protein [Propionibacteriales bacterium]